jgi:hypothetical protein
MKTPFSLNWGKPKQSEAPIERAIPLTQDEVTQINSYAEAMLGTLRKASPDAGYNGRSVERLANDLTTNGSQYIGDQRIRIANMYGAFLGRSIVTEYPQFVANWVRWKGDIGLELNTAEGELRKIIFPITKTFKHMENGKADSIYSLFLAVPEFVRSRAEG